MVNVWSVTEHNHTKFYIGRKPGKGTCHVGRFEKLYDPITGTISDHYSYIPNRYAQQPPAKWLYERSPR